MGDSLDRVLGLDISTTCTGAVITDGDGNLVAADRARMDLAGSPNTWWEKADFVNDMLRQLIVSVAPEPGTRWRLYVEEPAKRFRSGKGRKAASSAHTIVTLAGFNRTVAYCGWKLTGAAPVDVNPRSARKALGIKTPSTRGLKGVSDYQKDKMVKDAIVAHVLRWSSEEDLGFAKTRAGNWEVGCADVADAFVAARAGILLLPNGRA